MVELLIVIVILGVLSTVAVFAVRGITDKGDTAACQADYKTLETGIEAYLAQGGDSAVLTTKGQQALIDAGFLRAPGSTKYTVESATVIKSAGTCTYDPANGVFE